MAVQQFKWGVAGCLVARDVVHLGGVRYPVVQVPLVFRYIVTEVIYNNPVSSLKTSVRLWVERGCMDLLY